MDPNDRPIRDPPPFDRPIVQRGTRCQVKCHLPDGSRTYLDNVLFRDYSFSAAGLDPLEYAYAPTDKKKKTICGELQVCNVLKRRRTPPDDTRTEGYYGELCFDMTSQLCAVKVCYMETVHLMQYRGEKENAEQEISALQRISMHNVPHVAACWEVLFDRNPHKQSLNIVMPYYGTTSLCEYYLNAKKPDGSTEGGLTEEEGKSIFRQMMVGLQGLHHPNVGICHHDLSPQNIMVDDNGLVTIIDFGMALRIPLQGKRACLITPQGQYGKKTYMSHEIYAMGDRECFDGQAMDLWSMGVILFCMMTGNVSYDRPDTSDPLYHAMTRHLRFLLEDWQMDFSPQCIDLMEGMLQEDPSLRLTIDQILAHPWLQ